MTQEQRIKKAEQLRLAAQIIETGAEWETWNDLVESGEIKRPTDTGWQPCSKEAP